jgi:DNA polymerase-3 subunit epsilon
MLVISADQPFGRFAHASPPHRRAEELRRAGSLIEIVTEEEIRYRMGEVAPVGPCSKLVVTV